ncbi:cytochrome c oxidase assembly protein COX16 homolog, mitochondrial isoform X3 [Anas platyrhynchos]|uniref:cytochrome c oxidase assembly protein COX16 homolog, mitochondrial isoform X3 n=1 Tax=Anas platyrhynchos TaxID=8839 RepID=UPI000A393393
MGAKEMTCFHQTFLSGRCLRKTFCFDCRKSRGIELSALLLPHFSEIQMKRRLLTGETHSAAIVDPALKEKLKQNNVTLESEYEPQNWRFQVVFVASSVLLHWKRSHIPFNQAQLYIYEKEPTHVPDVHPWLLLY